MRRIDSPNRAAGLFGAGRDGFKAAVPGVSSATELTAGWFNHVQESLVRVVEAAGLDLSASDFDQFPNAIAMLTSAMRDAAITAAAGDATDKTNAARDDAALDATTKANAAQAAAIAAAAADATTKANAAQAASIAAAAADSTTKANAVIPSGTRMLFQQATAPVGWTKIMTYDNKALRIVSGAAGSGGTVPFTTAFSSGNVGGTALTTAQIPAHTHDMNIVFYNETGSGNLASGGASFEGSVNFTTSSVGGGGTHTHTINLDVAYVDVIIASKN